MKMNISESDLEFIKKEYLWQSIAIHVKEEFLKEVYKKTKEIPPYCGILNPITNSTLVLKPWFKTRDLYKLGLRLIQEGGIDGFLEGLCGKGKVINRYNQSEENYIEIPWEQVFSIGKHHL